MGLYTEGEKRASELLDRAIELSKRAFELEHKVRNGVMHKGRRARLAAEAAALREEAGRIFDEAEAIEAAANSNASPMVAA